MEKPLQVFCCYAREDQLTLLMLKKHLRPIQREGLIVVQADIDISPGEEWEQKISHYLNTAHIILLLISPDFMDSDYCYSKEMMRAMERHESREAHVIPIILRPARWQRAPFGKLQVLPTNAEPVTSKYWHTPDDAFFDVERGIEDAAEKLLVRPQIKSVTSPPPLSSSATKFVPGTPSQTFHGTKEQWFAVGWTKEEWLKLGNEHSNARRHQDALAAYEQAILLDPNYAFAYYGKGHTLYDLERYQEALVAYEQTILLDPNYAFAYAAKGNTLHALKRYQEALAAYEQTIRLDPNSAYAYYNKGNALHALKRYQEALQAFEQAILLDSNGVFAYDAKGSTLHALKQYQGALAAYEQVIYLDPNSANAYDGKGDAFYALERYQEALVAYEQAIRLDPNFADAYCGKGNALFNLERYQEALVACEQAIRLDPNFASAYCIKGGALHVLKRYEEALAAHEQAIRLDPNFAIAYHRKGCALEMLGGRQQEANQAYVKARQLGYNP